MVVAHCRALLHVKDLSSTYILVASIPLTDETTGIIDAAALDELGPEGLLVNVARGPVVDEKALYEALKDRRIAGAAVDVWYQYPASDGRAEPSSFPFGRLDNIIMTPTPPPPTGANLLQCRQAASAQHGLVHLGFQDPARRRRQYVSVLGWNAVSVSRYPHWIMEAIAEVVAETGVLKGKRRLLNRGLRESNGSWILA
jgi:hypothetical protein